MRTGSLARAHLTLQTFTQGVTQVQMEVQVHVEVQHMRTQGIMPI